MQIEDFKVGDRVWFTVRYTVVHATVTAVSKSSFSGYVSITTDGGHKTTMEPRELQKAKSQG